MSWEAVLPPDRYEMAVARLDAIKRQISVARDIPQFPGIKMDGDAPDRALASLTWGLPGRALFYAYAAFAGGDQSQLDIANDFLAQASLLVGRLPLSPHLYSGYTGLGWVARHLRGLFDATLPDPAADMEARVATALDLYDGGRFELIRGIVGCGVFLLEQPELSNGSRQLIAGLIERLENWAEWHSDGATWLRPPEVLAEGAGAEIAEGAYDFGIPHGLAGILSFLAACGRRNLERDRVRSLALALARWMIAHQLPPDNVELFPRAVDKKGNRYGSRLSWCYGDMSVGTSLLNASITFDGEDFREIRDVALLAARTAAARSMSSSSVVDGGLCHGAAGIAHMFNRIYQATRDVQFRDAAIRWYGILLDSPQHPEGISGFATRWTAGGNIYSVRDPGFLTGASGIGLALLAATTPVEPRWDRLLLVDLEPAA